MSCTISRRQMLAGIGGTVGTLALSRFVHAAQRADRPNVLFIAIDDLNDWIGCLGGHPQARTPNLDRLARRGLLFSNAHCPAPLCNASRAAMMTGVLPSDSGVYLNPMPWRQAMPDVVTIPQHFMAGGYRAIGTGKLYHNPYYDPASWDEFFPSKTKIVSRDPEPPRHPMNGIANAGHFDWGALDCRDEDMGDWQNMDWVCQQLSRRHDQPLFLAAGLIKPHLPWYVPGKYFDLFPLDKVTLPDVKKDDLDDVPQAGRELAGSQRDHQQVLQTDNWAKAVQAYLASIAFADACVGRIIDALDAGPLADNTIVALWSDHGWHLGEKLHWRKFSLWEESTRNPMMIVAPGLTTPGAVTTRPTNLMDLYPTLIELCGLPHRKLAGQSLVPLLKDPKAPWERPSLTTYQRGNHSLRSERWRYTRYHDGSEELYDHGSDPMEWRNLANDAKYDDVKRDLARWLPTRDAPNAPTEKPRGGQ